MAILLEYRIAAFTINMTMPEMAWSTGKKDKYQARVETNIKTVRIVVGSKIAPMPDPTMVVSMVFLGCFIASTTRSDTPAGSSAAQALHRK
jgi:hypothetical protein